MSYLAVRLRREMSMPTLYAVQYLELSNEFVFPVETTDFWNLLFVDRGALKVTFGVQTLPVKEGSLLFWPPGMPFGLEGDGEQACNVMRIGFDCTAKGMETLEGIYLRSVTGTHRELLRAFLNEMGKAFSMQKDDPMNPLLIRKKDAPEGSEMLAAIYLMELLYSVKRHVEEPRLSDKRIPNTTPPLLNQIIRYMEENITCKMTMKQLTGHFHVSSSYIQRLFGRYKQSSAMHYFNTMKLEHAKELLRKKERNITQIAEYLGYDNISYFCNQFKSFEGMSPREYRRSISALPNRSKLLQEE